MKRVDCFEVRVVPAESLPENPELQQCLQLRGCEGARGNPGSPKPDAYQIGIKLVGTSIASFSEIRIWMRRK